MQCKVCGNKLIKKTKKIKSSIVGMASTLEFIALVLGGLAYAYEPTIEYKPILLPLAIVFALFGHFLMFKKVKYLWCKSCKAEIDANA